MDRVSGEERNVELDLLPEPQPNLPDDVELLDSERPETPRIRMDWTALESAIDAKELQMGNEPVAGPSSPPASPTSHKAPKKSATTPDVMPRSRSSTLGGTLRGIFRHRRGSSVAGSATPSPEASPPVSPRRRSSSTMRHSRRRASTGTSRSDGMLDQCPLVTVSRSLAQRMAGLGSGPVLEASPRAATLSEEEIRAVVSLALQPEQQPWAWTLLSTHRLLMSSQQLLTALQELWDTSLESVRACCLLCGTWVVRLPMTLQTEPMVRVGLQHLLGVMHDHPKAMSSCKRLLGELEAIARKGSRPATVVATVNADKMSWLVVEVEALALELTLLTHQLFQRIQLHELVAIRWTRQHKWLHAPNVMAASNNGNVFTLWMSTRVLEGATPKQRALAIVRLVHTGVAFMDLSNFNGVMQVVASLANSAVKRLRKTWEHVPARVMEALETLRDFCRPKGNFRNLRAAMDVNIREHKPCMPYFPLWLTDLVMLEESGAAWVDDNGHVDRAKLMRLSKVLDNVVACQQRRYTQPSQPTLADYLLKNSHVCVDEAALFELSLACEPREK